MQQPSHNLDVAAGCFLSTPHELPASGPAARLQNYAPPCYNSQPHQPIIFRTSRLAQSLSQQSTLSLEIILDEPCGEQATLIHFCNDGSAASEVTWSKVQHISLLP